MVGEIGQEGLGIGQGVGLQSLADARVQSQPFPLSPVDGQRLLHERVDEAELPRVALALEEAGGDGLVKQAEERLSGEAGRFRQHEDIDRSADEGGEAEEVTAPGRESADVALQHATHP